jgi:hypothetical protein
MTEKKQEAPQPRVPHFSRVLGARNGIFVAALQFSYIGVINTKSKTPLLAKNARNGAPDRTDYLIDDRLIDYII